MAVRARDRAAGRIGPAHERAATRAVRPCGCGAARRGIRRAPALTSIALLLVLLVSLTLVVPLEASAQEAVSAEDYARSVSEARAALAMAEGRLSEPGFARTAADQVTALVPESATVTSGGRQLTVDGSAVHRLAARLAGAPDADARQRASDELTAHLASLERALGAPGAPPADDPAVLDEVLAGIGVRGQSALERWLSDLLEDVIDAVNRFFASLLDSEPASAGARTVFYVLSGAAALFVLALVYVVIRRWLRATAPAPRAIGGVSLADGPVVAAAEGLPADAAAYAAAAAAEGRYRDAVRALFGGAARELVGRGVIAHARTRTGAELLADVRSARPGIHSPLVALNAVFEPAWYGHSDPGAAGYDAARARYAEVMALAEGGEPS